MLGQVFGKIRWATLVVLFLVSLAQPTIGRLGQPTWLQVLGYAGYSVVISLLQRHVSWLRSPAHTALLDLALVSALFMIAANPSGPLFVLFLLSTVRVSCTLTLARGLMCTFAALLVLFLVSPTLPLWLAGPEAQRGLFTRLIVVALANIGAAVLLRKLEQEHATAREAHELAQRHAEHMQGHEAFVVAISHELRTPLTALRSGLGMLELSMGDRMREDEAHLLRTARRNSERLGLLVSDLLTYNQLDADALRLEHAPLDLNDVVCHAVSEIAALLAEKGQSVTLELAARLPFVGDARRLQQVLTNLLANAHEHTPIGTRIVVASCMTADEALLTVADDGPGIPSSAHELVFGRFQQLNPAGSGGSGLGLAISRRLIELHGGRLWVESWSASGNRIDAEPMPLDEATGTRFCVALPRHVV